MDLAAVVVLGGLVAAAGREVERSRDLLVEEDVLHRVGDVRVEADGELADVARALVGVEDLVELLAVALAGGLDDLAVLEDEADVLEALAVVDGGSVVLEHAVDAVAHGRGEALAVGDVVLAAAGDDADALDREGQVGLARTLDVDLVGARAPTRVHRLIRRVSLRRSVPVRRIICASFEKLWQKAKFI